MSILVNTLLLSLSINTIVFVISFLKSTDKLTDITYAITFISLAIYTLTTNQNISSTQIILSIMIVLWAVRLGGYLLHRIVKIKKDKRFNRMRKDFVKLAGFWALQGISVWIISIPFIIYNSKEFILNSKSVLFGMIIWIIGLVIESIADAQKFSFKNEASNANKWIDSGIWKYSRHPNYFGEILCWIGIYLYAASSFKGVQFLSILSPVYISVLLIFVSGIPLLEKRYDKKFKDDKNYSLYKKNTSILIPWKF